MSESTATGYHCLVHENCSVLFKGCSVVAVEGAVRAMSGGQGVRCLFKPSKVLLLQCLSVMPVAAISKLLNLSVACLHC